MVYRSTLIWTLRRVGICLVVLFVVLNVFLRVETYRFQRPAEHLMADIQALKLRQSNWLEADHLISRWGKYGNYKGHCDASFCRYSIVLNSPEITLERWAFAKAPANWNNHFAVRTASLFFMLCEYLGGRSVTVRTTFVVDLLRSCCRCKVVLHDWYQCSRRSRDMSLSQRPVAIVYRKI